MKNTSIIYFLILRSQARLPDCRFIEFPFRASLLKSYWHEHKKFVRSHPKSKIWVEYWIAGVHCPFHHVFFIHLEDPPIIVNCCTGKFANVCISPGGRFPPFKPEGKPPKRAERGPRGLTLCRVFRENTCCDAAQTIPAFASIRSLASAGEASQECLDLWEVLECSICHPHIGTTPGLPLICSSFCDKVFGACSNAYFSMDGKTLVGVLFALFFPIYSITFYEIWL